MGGTRPILRISFGLVLLTSTILLAVELLGWLPTHDDETTQLRVQIAETIAVQSMAAAERSDLGAIRAVLHLAVDRNEEVLSAGMRSGRDRLVVSVGNHRDLWNPPTDGDSSATHIRVPLYRDGEPWAAIELRFTEIGGGSLLSGLWEHSFIRILLFVGGFGFVAYGFYLRHTLRYLDPSAVIPTRVQATLDVITDGVMIIDSNDVIVMANEALASRLRLKPAGLMGRKASSLGWQDRAGNEVTVPLPWVLAMRDGAPFAGESLTLNRSARHRTVLVVNGAPVLDGWGRSTGAIVTVSDVTDIERNRAELERALGDLEKSRDETRLQNEELQVLARSDPLTGAANRRSFMDHVEPLFDQAREERRDLACIMVDIDHFKLVNDNHGHQIGDEVIRRVAEAMMSQLGGSSGIVCRYGGEEFCAALADATPEEAEAVAERIRRQIEAPGFASVPVTASLGVSTIRDGAHRATVLMDQADQALYASKENGRNRITRFDRLPGAF